MDLLIVVGGNIENLAAPWFHGFDVNDRHGTVVDDFSSERTPQSCHHSRTAGDTDGDRALGRALRPFRVADEAEHGSGFELILGFGGADSESGEAADHSST
jgi:hypothetical protein